MPTFGTMAKAKGLSEPELLVYRSNTLGSDKRVTNYGGGNTSSKIRQKDPLSGAEVEVLWVKGSGATAPRSSWTVSPRSTWTNCRR
ncbi:hypothetical protein NKK52_29570 [Mesorhizobium sp. C277A]|uniref:hypothetical protein n=1 Tax=Mesorhizobium sp. C277A TaxID=2956827 RepID=UPI003338DA66